VLKKYPLTVRFIVVIFLPLCIGFIFLFLHLKSSLTPTSAKLTLEGLNYPVEITHDSYGTPGIFAKTDHDAYFALGFKHASDRLWQLEIQRKLAQGRLSELFGVETLSQDIATRNLGLYDAAKKTLSNLKVQGKAIIAILHDDRCFDIVTPIVVMENGKLIDNYGVFQKTQLLTEIL